MSTIGTSRGSRRAQFRSRRRSRHAEDEVNRSKLVESRCGAATLGRAYLLPPLSSGGALVVRPWLRFHTPLIGTTPRGFPCCVRFPCVHAAATTPAQRLGVLLRSLHPAVSAFPERVIGSACASSFSRLARRSLALRPAHSRGHQFVTRYPKASATSLPP